VAHDSPPQPAVARSEVRPIDWPHRVVQVSASYKLAAMKLQSTKDDKTLNKTPSATCQAPTSDNGGDPA
jgi:hypothetical protein